VSTLNSGARVACRRTCALISTVAALGAAAALAGPANAAVTSPHSINVFYHRDFVQASGFQAGDLVTVEALRNNTVIGTASNIVPTDDPTTPPFDGLVTINHPGGACWDNFTPDLQRGDVIRTTITNAPLGSTTAVDTTPIANIEVTQQAFESGPGQVRIKGFAADAAGNPLPIDQIQQRMVANQQAFDLNGRRTLRAGGAGNDGTLSYDPIGPGNPKGINWTATYGSTVPGVPPLDAHDVAMAVGAESRGIWLGTNPAAFSPLSGFLIESTLAEVGGDKPAVPGGSVGCPALAGNAVTATDAAHMFNGQSVINAGNVAGDLTVSGVANNATAVSVTLTDHNGLSTPPRAATLTGAVGSPQSWNATIPAADVSKLADGPVTAAGQYTAGGTITGTTLNIRKDVVAPGAPTAAPEPGEYHIAQSVQLSSSDQTATIHHTADGTTPTALSPESNPVSVTATQTLKAIAVDPAGNASPVTTLAYTITPLTAGGGTGTAAAGLAGAIPGASAVLGGQTSHAAGRPAVRGLRIAVGSRRALHVSVHVGSSANVVRFRIFRARNGQPVGRVAVTLVRLRTASGSYTLRGAALRRLRAGRYVLMADAGANGSALGAAARVPFTLR
jgi:hypothetical protein